MKHALTFNVARRRLQAPANDHDGPATPRPGEVMREIGLILAVHLALALCIVLALGALGIV